MKCDLRVGYTGTRHGLTAPQRLTLERYLRALRHRYEVIQGDHGMCVGGDDQFNTLCHDLHLLTGGHPPVDGKYVVNCVVDEIFPAKPYLMRDHDIVDISRWLIACPRELAEQWRGSGTWATIRYAEKMGKKVVFIWPDGRITKERVR